MKTPTFIRWHFDVPTTAMKGTEKRRKIPKKFVKTDGNVQFKKEYNFQL